MSSAVRRPPSRQIRFTFRRPPRHDSCMRWLGVHVTGRPTWRATVRDSEQLCLPVGYVGLAQIEPFGQPNSLQYRAPPDWQSIGALILHMSHVKSEAGRGGCELQGQLFTAELPHQERVEPENAGLRNQLNRAPSSKGCNEDDRNCSL